MTGNGHMVDTMNGRGSFQNHARQTDNKVLLSGSLTTRLTCEHRKLPAITNQGASTQGSCIKGRACRGIAQKDEESYIKYEGKHPSHGKQMCKLKR